MVPWIARLALASVPSPEKPDPAMVTRTAALGILCGLGAFLPLALGTVFLLLTLFVGGLIDRAIDGLTPDRALAGRAFTRLVQLAAHPREDRRVRRVASPHRSVASILTSTDRT
jgi:uncharacterized membrane protein YhiD involved in acid resistance